LNFRKKNRLERVIEKLYSKGKRVFALFDSPEELDKLITTDGVFAVFVTEEEAEKYIKFRSENFHANFALFILGRPKLPYTCQDILRRLLLVEFLDSVEEAEEKLKEIVNLSKKRRIKWWLAVIEDFPMDFRKIRRFFSSERVRYIVEKYGYFDFEPSFSISKEEIDLVGFDREKPHSGDLHPLKSPEEVMEEIEKKLPSGVVVDISWRRGKDEEEMAKKWFLNVDTKYGVSGEEFFEAWERGDFGSELFKVSGLKFLKLVEIKLRKGEAFPPVMVFTKFGELFSSPEVRSFLKERCNIAVIASKNWDLAESDYEWAEAVVESFISRTALYYAGLKKLFPPFRCFSTEEGKEADYITIPFGKTEKDIQRIVAMAYIEKYGSKAKAANKLGISTATLNDRLKE